MFRFLLRKSPALSGALLVVACAAQPASADVERTTLPVPPSASSARAVDHSPTRAPRGEATNAAIAPAVSRRRAEGEYRGEQSRSELRGAGTPPRDPDPRRDVEWRFHAGSSIHAAPVVAADGTVYVGTGDGYVEAVNADGSLKWSYTVEGAVAWSPLIDAGEHVIVATSAQRLYSISASGLPAWEVRPPAHVTTELSLVAPGGFLFGATDGSVWAYSIHSTALWHTEIGGTITGAPSVRGSHAAIGTSAGLLVVLDGAAKRIQAKLGARLRGAPAILGDGSIVALAGSTLFRLDSHGSLVSRREGVDSFGVASVGLVAIEVSGDLIALGDGGAVTARVPLPVKASAPPVEISPGVACVGAESGELFFVGPGPQIRRVAIARAPLHRPVVDAPRGRVVVAAGSGTVAAVAIAPPER